MWALGASLPAYYLLPMRVDPRWATLLWANPEAHLAKTQPSTASAGSSISLLSSEASPPSPHWDGVPASFERNPTRGDAQPASQPAASQPVSAVASQTQQQPPQGAPTSMAQPPAASSSTSASPTAPAATDPAYPANPAAATSAPSTATISAPAAPSAAINTTAAPSAIAAGAPPQLGVGESQPILSSPRMEVQMASSAPLFASEGKHGLRYTLWIGIIALGIGLFCLCLALSRWVHSTLLIKASQAHLEAAAAEREKKGLKGLDSNKQNGASRGPPQYEYYYSYSESETERRPPPAKPAATKRPQPEYEYEYSESDGPASGADKKKNTPATAGTGGDYEYYSSYSYSEPEGGGAAAKGKK